MAIVDRNAAEFGVSQIQLMESSGHAVARAVKEIAAEGSKIAIIGGRGNNGGDAFVSARFLRGFEVEVYLIGRPESIATPIAKKNWEVLQTYGYNTKSIKDASEFYLENADIVIDGLLGTGIKGPVREPDKSIIGKINSSNATIVSIDIPSGFDADGGRTGISVDADLVVTFHDIKPGIKDHKNVIIADIGIPKSASIFVGPGDLLTLKRPGGKHKGEFGRVMIVGGGPYTGAPLLSSLGALRAGADLVYVAVPSSIANEIQGYAPEIIVEPFEGELLLSKHVDKLIERSTQMDVVVIGPGLGNDEKTITAIRSFLEKYEGKAIIDADALEVVQDTALPAEVICTPHLGEFIKMGGPNLIGELDDKMTLVQKFAEGLGQVVLVKGERDIISDGRDTRVNQTGNPGMTVGGTGDILAGVTGALFCTQDGLTAASIAAYVVGKAGDFAVEEKGGYGILPTDLLPCIPTALGGRI